MSPLHNRVEDTGVMALPTPPWRRSCPRAVVLPTSEVEIMEFHIGDKVRLGVRVGTVTDVGTVLIEVKINEGSSRVVCPWELARTRDR